MAVGTTAFPTSLDTIVELVEITNNASSTLSGNVLIGDTTIGVVDIGEFPTTGYGTIVDDLTTPTKVEIISWTGKSGSNLTGCTRGTQGTSAAAFSSGNYIEVRPTAGHHEALRGAVIAIETKLGTGSTIAVNKLEALTASRLMVTDASGFASAASVTATEAGYLSGVTSAIQTQLGTKAGSGAVTGSGLTMATARLLGRTTASSGAIEEISIGSGLSMSAGTLTATGGGGSGDVVGPGSATDNAVSRFDGTTGKLVKNSVVTIADTTGNMAGVGTLNTHTIPVGTDTFVLLTANQTLTTKTLTSPDINGGTADSLTSLSVRSTGAAFDLLFANTEVLTGNKTLTIKVNDTSRTVDLGGNLTLAAAFSTSGANALTLTTTGATNVTLPTTGTLVNSAVTSLSSLTTVGTITSGGLGTGAVIGGVTMTLGSDADGDIYYRSSNVLTRLAKGTALQRLRMNAGATAPEWFTDSGGGLTIGTTAIASGTAGRILYETSGNVVGEIAGSSVDANGAVQFAATARSSGVAQYFRINTPADTGQTASTESVGAYFGGNGSGSTVTRTWANGAITTQRENVFVAPTYAFVSGSNTITTAATVAITGAPVVGANAAITNPYALWVQSGVSQMSSAIATKATLRSDNTGTGGGGTIGTDVPIGIQGTSTGGSVNTGGTVGVYGYATNVAAGGSRYAVGGTFLGQSAARAIGVIGSSDDSTVGSRVEIGGIFVPGLISVGVFTEPFTTIASVSAGLVVSNGIRTHNIARFYDNTTLVMNIADGGAVWTTATSSSAVALRVDSAASPSVDVVQFTLNGTNAWQLGSAGAVTMTSQTANTNTVATAKTINVNSTGTAAAGFGGQVLYQLETTTTNSQPAAALSWLWTTATHASRTSAITFSTVDNAASLAERWRLSTNGAGTGVSTTTTGFFGGTNVTGMLAESITLSTSGTTTDSTIDLPANSIILSVTGRITTTITTATDWKLGDATISDRFSDANATLTAGTTTVGINQWKADRTTAGQGAFQQSTAKVRITTTGTPGAGVIRITVHYITLSAPTS